MRRGNDCTNTRTCPIPAKAVSFPGLHPLDGLTLSLLYLISDWDTSVPPISDIILAHTPARGLYFCVPTAWTDQLALCSRIFLQTSFTESRQNGQISADLPYQCAGSSCTFIVALLHRPDSMVCRSTRQMPYGPCNQHTSTYSKV